MTPKQKAQELIESMAFSCRECDYEAKAKQCALIAVDEIMSALTYLPYGLDYLNKISDWQEVKEEIEAL
jgi:hypothetical protein